ncbi:MAG TPA: family 78 glycoside hydrolase catalytic domain [Bryobacteraceae bacterium]|jgi:alpha-L-rhamnosidase|nr:family 78 glycoside hydrolase catalytic domain [Bryobacteraceae bacterium]
MPLRALLLTLLCASVCLAGPVKLRTDYLENPLGLDSSTPRFSWQSDSDARNWRQNAYEILVASSAERLKAGTADVWDSGKQLSPESVGIPYAGPKLESRRRYFWGVRVWGGEGSEPASSLAAPVWWETGLMNAEDWTAQWITRANPEEAADRAGMRWIWVAGENALNVAPKTAASFRTTITLAEKPVRAALFILAHAEYKVTVNGHETGAKKDWSDFDRQDIADRLVAGKNVIEVGMSTLEPPFWMPRKKDAGAPAGITVLIKAVRPNGELERFFSDGGWEAKGAASAGWKPAQVVAGLDDNRFGGAGPLPQPAALLRKDFAAARQIRSARIYATALGSYRLFVNGQRVSGDVLTPEFTDYRKRVFYQTYDVTSLVRRGKNTIGALLGDGWYSSPLIWTGIHLYPPPNRLRAQLEILYGDGTRETVNSDQSWETSESAILHSAIYAGETYDARLEQPGWNKPGFEGKGWAQAVVGASPGITISSPVTAPVQVGESITPKTVTRGANGAYIFDMGQNMVGWVTLRVKGAAGTRVRLRFAEILNPDGSIYRANLRNADATDLYTLRGGGEEVFAPHFTFHGFKYVEVTGYPGKPDLTAITGNVVGSLNQPPTGTLSTSSELVNKMWKIGIWGQRGNFLSIPTDCPQRDERLGWTGDAEAFWRTGAYNFDIAAFTRKYMLDMIDAQTPEGAFPNVAPDLLPFPGFVGAPGWGDAGVIIPWTAWKQYGDTQFIRENWEPMRRWMDFIARNNPNYLREKGVGPDFSDWLAPDERSPKPLVATAYWALIAGMMTQMARAVGEDSDAARYAALEDHIRAAYQHAFVKDNGEVSGGTQTAYLLTLYTRMAPPALEQTMVNNLVKDIESRNWHLSTGFLGTPFLLFTLSRHGRADAAYRLLLNETYPSWGYMLSKGATTWWERWNGDTGDPAMNSYNHYAFGSVVAWVYRVVAGIDTSAAAPGFREITIRPLLDSRITHARGEYDSVRGKIISDWKGTASGPFSINVTIPPNTTARVFLPAIANAQVTEDGKPVPAETKDGSYVVAVGSGSYHFEVK